MTFLRLTRGDLVAAVAALALLVVLSVTWYGTRAGDDARAAKTAVPAGGESGQVARAVNNDADRIYGASTDNAWQASAPIDRLILFTLLAAAAMATAAAWLRAAGARFDPPLTPSAVTTWVALVGTMLLAFRIAQLPATEAGAVVKLGAPLGLVCVGLIALGARSAWRAETAAAAPAVEPAPEREVALVGASSSEATTPLWDHDAEDEGEWDVDTDETWAIGWDHDTDETDALPKMEVLPDKPRRRFGRRRR